MHLMSAVAQVVSMFAISYGVMQLLYGPVGDRWGKYRVVSPRHFGMRTRLHFFRRE
jgi:MFS family permease